MPQRDLPRVSCRNRPAGSYPESLAIGRDVTIAGGGSGSTTLAGWVRLSGAATVVALNGLRIDATAASSPLCPAFGLDATGGSRVSGFDLVVVGRPAAVTSCSVLIEGFENGDIGGFTVAGP